MTNAAKSVVAWGIYGLLAGMALLFQPDLTLQFLGFNTTSEHWILMVALMMMGLGFYYIVLGITEVKQFFLISTIGRTIFFLTSSIIIIMGKAPISMLIFGVIDLLTAVWTVIAMYFDKKARRVASRNRQNPPC